MFDSQDGACHDGSEAKVPEVKGEEGQKAAYGTGIEEMEESCKPDSSSDIPLLAPFHGCFLCYTKQS